MSVLFKHCKDLLGLKQSKLLPGQTVRQTVQQPLCAEEQRGILHKMLCLRGKFLPAPAARSDQHDHDSTS